MVSPCLECPGRVSCILKFNTSDSPFGILVVPQTYTITVQKTEVDHSDAQKYGSRISDGRKYRKLRKLLTSMQLTSDNHSHWKWPGISGTFLIISKLDSKNTSVEFPTLPRGLFGGFCGLWPADGTPTLGLMADVRSSPRGRILLRKIISKCLPHHLRSRKPQSYS